MNFKVKGKKEKGKIGNRLLYLAFFLWFSLCLCVSAVNSPAQTGGTFDLSHNVLASGGGSNSAAGAFRVDGTAGQPSAGTVSVGIPAGGGPFVLRGGFWAFDQLAPTAAGVAVSGRVSMADGRGIRNATLTLTDTSGALRTTVSGSLGYYRFEDVPAGQTYILSVSSRRFTFSSPSRVINANEEISDADFIAN